MGWSDKYKKSIDCNNPKGFSQKAHCAGRKIRKENMKLSELKETIRQVIEARGPSRGFNKLATVYQKEALKHQSMVKDQKRLAAAFVAEKDPKKKEKAKKAIIDHHHKVKDQEKKMKRAEQEMLNGLDKEKIDLDEGSINEGPSREEFRIAAMAIRKQAKFRNVSAEQAIQDQLNALKLLQRYIKKGDVKKYTGMNLSEAEAKTLNEVNTNFFYLNRNYDKVLGEISHDLYYEIDRIIGDDVYEKVKQKFEDEFGELAFYHPRHDKWHPKDKAKIVEKELDKMVSAINKEMSKKTKKVLDELKKSALSIKKHIKISLQNK